MNYIKYAILCGVLSLSNLSHASDIKINNHTPYDIEVRVDTLCSDPLSVIEPHWYRYTEPLKHYPIKGGELYSEVLDGRYLKCAIVEPPFFEGRRGQDHSKIYVQLRDTATGERTQEFVLHPYKNTTQIRTLSFDVQDKNKIELRLFHSGDYLYSTVLHTVNSTKTVIDLIVKS